jgi:hypothetical protein
MFPGPKLKAFFTDKVLEQKKSLPGVQARQAVQQTFLFFYRFPALAWRAMEHGHGG